MSEGRTVFVFTATSHDDLTPWVVVTESREAMLRWLTEAEREEREDCESDFGGYRELLDGMAKRPEGYGGWVACDRDGDGVMVVREVRVTE